MRVQLGNPAAKEGYPDESGELRHRPVDGPRVTTIEVPATYTPLEAFAVVTAGDGAWNAHSAGADVADTIPDWVECDDDLLRQLLAAYWPGVTVGRPKSWKGEG